MAKIARMSMSRVISAFLVCALAVACNPSTPKFSFNQPEQRGRLDKNGLRFVIMPDTTTQLVEVDVRYEVGSREDPPGKAGLAHLVEHLMFQQKPDGPTTPPLFHFLLQASVFVNAYTNNDTTHYMTNARAEQLDSLLKIEAMRMHYLCETITNEEFERERDVVRNEIRGGNRTPEGLIEPLTLSAIYPKGHAYEQPVGGNDEQISSATLKDACDFMHKYYVPERATVIVAGGVTVDDSVKSIKHWFGAIEKRPPAPRHKVEPVIVTKQEVKTYELDIERPWVTVSWALPDATTPKGEAAQFGIWSAFFDSAVKADKYECATDAQPMLLGGQEAPVFTIALELKSLDRLDECLDFVWKAAKKAHRGWDYGTWDQLEEQKNRRKASFIAQLEPLTSRTNQMGELVQFSRDFDFDSQDRYIYHQLDKFGKFDQEKVGSAVRGLLDERRASVVIFKPSKAGLKGDRRSKIKFQTQTHEANQETPEVDPGEAKRPIKVATELKGLEGAHRFQLGNGMRVVMLPINAWPVISAELVFDIGSSSTPDNPMLAKAAAQFLNPPADGEAQARTGVNMSCRATPDHTICSARGMNIYLDVVVKGLERLIRAGDYSQEEIENFQKRERLAYKHKRPQVEQEFRRQQLTAIFGPDHAYTKTGISTVDAINKLGRDSLSSFRTEHYTAANATLVIVGNFDAKQAESLIRDNFGSWSAGHKDHPIAKDPFKRVGPAYVGVLGEEDPQVDVSIAYPSPAGKDGQEAARQVLTEMLNQRMWDVRAKLGATYGTYAFHDERLGPGAYRMGGAVDAPRTGEAIKMMRDSVDGLRQGKDFDITFVRARRKILQDLLGESTMTVELADRLGDIARFGLDANYYNTLLQQVAAVSPAQIRALLAHELQPTNEVVVLMGDRKSVTKAFTDAGIKDVKLLEPDYKQ